ncbi:hypothetical protein ONZ43_g6513 [Nemania bipapillata]|uniref:Uncharacterized protein n=1 Tax=Nemania bipapillata TaxID=110536 RepID=A0ACC2HZF4_9PEZI|nr:hypothetical protein ONZ43_g6513 [Nemania bipapillata]
MKPLQADKRPHVGVIGAGVSGLRCADILLSHGFKVTILEARSRIGGRPFANSDFGSGPNWIHTWNSGEIHPIWRLAQETDTPVHHWNEKQLIYDSAGVPLADDQADRLSSLLWDIINDAFKMAAAAKERDDGTSIPAEASLYDFVRGRVREEAIDDNEKELLMQMSEMWGAYVGEPVWKQSLRFAWMEECCGGEEMFVESSYSAILDKIYEPSKERAEILLNKEVVSVRMAEQRLPGQKVALATSDGDRYRFDDVVVTIPLGWLQKHLDCFEPPLPARTGAAITNLKLSQLEKVFITFSSAFWITDTNRDIFPGYTNWLAPSYAQDTNPDKWPQEVWNMASFTAPNKHPTLLFYLYGDCSRYIVNSIHGKDRKEKYEFLRAFFSAYYSRLPGFDVEKEACRPTAILATEWLKDDLCGNGSYCNFQVGIEDADKDVLALRDGCPERRLWFCGEHAAPFEECGTVAGAYLSGESVAKKIIELYGDGFVRDD